MADVIGFRSPRTRSGPRKTGSVKRLARLAGLLYLIVAISGGFAELFVRQSLVVPDNAAATANNIADSAMLFRIGFVADLVNITVFLLLAFALYQLLKPVNQQIAATFVIFNVVAVSIMGANLLNHFAALLIASKPEYAAAFGARSSEALVLFFTELHAQGYLIGGIFFGLWLLPLGYLVYRSGYFPRVLGIMLMIGCFGYLTDTFVSSLFPSVGATVGFIFALVAGIAELSFLLWLIIMGAKVPQRDEQTPTAAAAA
jgi:uncharacterized protein DUF4386